MGPPAPRTRERVGGPAPYAPIPSHRSGEKVHGPARRGKPLLGRVAVTGNAILWYDAAAGKWIDESQSDPTLKARAESGNLVTRRLKHFSGYLLWVGLGSYNVTSGMGGDFAGGGW